MNPSSLYLAIPSQPPLRGLGQPSLLTAALGPRRSPFLPSSPPATSAPPAGLPWALVPGQRGIMLAGQAPRTPFTVPAGQKAYWNQALRRYQLSPLYMVEWEELFATGVTSVPPNPALAADALPLSGLGQSSGEAQAAMSLTLYAEGIKQEARAGKAGGGEADEYPHGNIVSAMYEGFGPGYWKAPPDPAGEKKREKRLAPGATTAVPPSGIWKGQGVAGLSTGASSLPPLALLGLLLFSLLRR